jgi:hypothetical protein
MLSAQSRDIGVPICSANRSPRPQPSGEQHLLRAARRTDTNGMFLIIIQSPVDRSRADWGLPRPLSDSLSCDLTHQRACADSASGIVAAIEQQRAAVPRVLG